MFKCSTKTKAFFSYTIKVNIFKCTFSFVCLGTNENINTNKDTNQ